MFRKLRNRGQSPVEYATMVIVIVAALLAMQNYFKRSVQGRWRQSSDGIGEQYDPRFATANIVHRISGQTTTAITVQNTINGVRTMRDDASLMTERKDGFTRVDAE